MLWCYGVLANPQHTARNTVEYVTVHYFCHPLFGKSVKVLERHHYGDTLYYLVLVFDSSRLLLPAWMTDALYCRELRLESAPFCSVSALCALKDFLERWFDRQ